MNPQNTYTERIKQIAQKRYKSTRRGTIIVTLLVVLLIIFSSVNPLPILITFVFIVGYLSFLLITNFNNSKHLSIKYRKFNNFFYKDLAFLVKIFSIISIIKSLFSFLNPMGGFKDPDYSRRSKALEGIAGVAGVSIAQRMINDANEVESLFAANDFNKENNTYDHTAGNTTPV